MKKFLTRISIFFLYVTAIYIVAYSITVFLNREKAEQCRLQKDTVSLILGDSHTMWGIDGSYVNRLENVSLNAEGYIYTYAKLRAILKHNTEIKTIYLGLSYHNLSGYFDDYIFGNNSRYFMPRYLGVLSFKELVSLYTKKPANVLTLAPFVFKDGFRNVLGNNCSFLGTFPSEQMTDTLDMAFLKRRIQEQFYSGDVVYPPSKFNMKYLNKIIQLCKEKNIELIALKTPLHPRYKKLIPEEYIGLWSEIIDTNHLKVCDLSNIDLPNSCFLPDADHVNYKGALITSKQFAEYHQIKQKNENF